MRCLMRRKHDAMKAPLRTPTVAQARQRVHYSGLTALFSPIHKLKIHLRCVGIDRCDFHAHPLA